MKIFKLTYNELVKLFKKPSITIIFVLILISAAILPVGISKMPKDIYVNNILESNKYLLQEAKQNADLLKQDKTLEGKILYHYALIDEDVRQIYVDYKLGHEDWRNGAIENYESACYELAALELVLKGYGQDQIMNKLQGIDTSKVENYYKISLAKRKEIESELKIRKEKLRKIIETNDYKSYIEEEINEIQGFILNNEKQINEYEKLKDKKPTTKDGKENLEQLKKSAEEAEKSIKVQKEDLKLLQFRLENDINYDLGNWKSNSIKTIEIKLRDLRMELMTEKEYALNGSQAGYYTTYDDYVKNFNKKKTETINDIKTIWYGLENNIPSLKDITDARSTVDNTYEIYVILAVIMVIIIGGGIVATEFSKGTIRLLLTRPVSRWKVLLSKLLSILIVGLSLVILGIVILYVSSGVVFGFETFKTPILQMVNGSIVQQSYISFLLPKVVLSCASLVFIASLVFTISTLAKNTALAVAISMVLYLGAAPMTDLLVGMKQVWIINTLIPYINSSYFRIIPMTSEVVNEGFGMQMQYTSGAIQLLIVSLVMLAIAFITFIKKDVKN